MVSALTHPLFITLGIAFGLPLNACKFWNLQAAESVSNTSCFHSCGIIISEKWQFRPIEITGFVLISIGFFLALLPINWTQSLRKRLPVRESPERPGRGGAEESLRPHTAGFTAHVHWPPPKKKQQVWQKIVTVCHNNLLQESHWIWSFHISKSNSAARFARKCWMFSSKSVLKYFESTSARRQQCVVSDVFNYCTVITWQGTDFVVQTAILETDFSLLPWSATGPSSWTWFSLSATELRRRDDDELRQANVTASAGTR